MKRKATPARIGAALVLAPAVLFLASGPALAASNVNITNTETIQAHLNADGSVQDARVYEQVALQGDGTVTFNNPVSTKNLRNLDGFGNFEVKNGSIISTQTVNGEKRLRSVSDYGKKLPLSVAVVYKLDGKIVDARDVVGKSGLLEVRYTVANVTSWLLPVTFATEPKHSAIHANDRVLASGEPKELRSRSVATRHHSRRRCVPRCDRIRT